MHGNLDLVDKIAELWEYLASDFTVAVGNDERTLFLKNYSLDDQEQEALMCFLSAMITNKASLLKDAKLNELSREIITHAPKLVFKFGREYAAGYSQSCLVQLVQNFQ